MSAETRCEICGSTSLRVRLTGVRGPVLECDRCHTFRVQDIVRAPDQEQLFYATIDEQRYVGYFGPFRKGQYAQVLRGINAPPDSTLLDVGASYGWMVEVGLVLGFDSYGLEPGAAPWPERIHNRMFRRSLEQYAQEAGRQFDVITNWHVLTSSRPSRSCRMPPKALESRRHLGGGSAHAGWMDVQASSRPGEDLR